ncbi:YrdB family protein [Spirillospora sp. NPDC049652]
MLTIAKGANLAVMFFLELGALAAVCYWGFKLDSNWAVRIVAGLGAPIAMGTLWGLFAAGGGENATYALHGIARAAFEIAWFGTAAVALYAAAAVTPALVFAAVYAVNAILRLTWKQ